MAAVKDFSVEERLATLVKVQKIESKIDEIKKLRGELPMEVKDLEDEIEGLNTRLGNIQADVDAITSFIDQRRQDQKDAAEMLKKYEKQQGSVKNSREFEAINKEIEIQELEIKSCEKKINDSNFDIEGKQGQMTDVKTRIETIEDVLNIKKGELEKIIAETEREEAELIEKSSAARSHVEPRILASYDRIRGSYKNGLAVVSVDRNSCGGCFNVIPPQRQAEIRLRKKIIACEHCGRVLADSEIYNEFEA
jgi:uncharacterized protein